MIKKMLLVIWIAQIIPFKPFFFWILENIYSTWSWIYFLLKKVKRSWFIYLSSNEVTRYNWKWKVISSFMNYRKLFKWKPKLRPRIHQESLRRSDFVKLWLLCYINRADYVNTSDVTCFVYWGEIFFLYCVMWLRVRIFLHI